MFLFYFNFFKIKKKLKINKLINKLNKNNIIKIIKMIEIIILNAQATFPDRASSSEMLPHDPDIVIYRTGCGSDDDKG